MRRRQFLTSGTALLSVALAGCAHPPVVLDMEEATVGDVVDEVTMTVGPDSPERAVVTSAIENGSTTRRGRTNLFGRGADTIRVEDTFYDVSETRLESSEVTVYEVLVDFDPANSTPELGMIEYADLPAADRKRLDSVVPEAASHSQDGYDIGVGYGTASEVGNESVFVPERQYDVLVHDGNRYRVAVDSRSASEATYRYEVTEVASGVEAFADQVRDQYLFALSGLSGAERDVVEGATDGGYFEDSDAFRSVVEQIRNHEAVRADDFYGTWLLEYDGTEYLTYVEW